jgi:ribulose-bisphosphate carboxylase large chain
MSVRQAWSAVQERTPLPVYAEHMPELRRALAFFGSRA